MPSASWQTHDSITTYSRSRCVEGCAWPLLVFVREASLTKHFGDQCSRLEKNKQNLDLLSWHASVSAVTLFSPISTGLLLLLQQWLTWEQSKAFRIHQPSATTFEYFHVHAHTPPREFLPPPPPPLYWVHERVRISHLLLPSIHKNGTSFLVPFEAKLRADRLFVTDSNFARGGIESAPQKVKQPTQAEGKFNIPRLKKANRYSQPS